MENFSQKWTLVSLKKPLHEGTQFFWKDWPLHVSIAPTFAIEWTDSLLQDLSDLVSQTTSFSVTAEKELQWGKIGATKLESTPEVLSLHTSVTALLTAAGALFNEPQYIGDNFIPHCTIQQKSKMELGDIFNLQSLTLIDMFADGDGYQRRVVRTMPFAKSM